MFRIALFLGTNVAILLVLGISMSLLGIDGILDEQGINLNLRSLLFFSSIIGFTGSFISLFISKWIAKRSMGVIIITSPKNETEKWLLKTLDVISNKANIKTPDFGIFNSEQLNAFATGRSKNNSLVKILGNGTLTKPLIISAHGYSKTAKEKIEKIGGSIEKINSKDGEINE